jgi:hypothetical protein
MNPQTSSFSTQLQKHVKIQLNFFKSAFEMQKQTQFHKTQLQKHVNIASQKLRFKLIF